MEWIDVAVREEYEKNEREQRIKMYKTIASALSIMVAMLGLAWLVFKYL